MKKRYFEKYTADEINSIKLTANDSAARVARALTLGEIIITDYQWTSTFVNMIAKRVTVPDGITPSYKNRTKKNNEVFFIASDDGQIQHSTIRPDVETSLPIYNMVQSEFWPMFGVASGDLDQEAEALETIGRSFDIDLDKMGWTLLKAAVSAAPAADHSADLDKKAYASFVDELLTTMEDRGFGNAMTDGILFINPRRLAQIKTDLRNNNQKMEDLFMGKIVTLPTAADTAREYGANLAHTEAYLIVVGNDLARNYVCLTQGKEIFSEDTPAIDNSFKMGVRAITRRALAVINSNRIAYLKMNAALA